MSSRPARTIFIVSDGTAQTCEHVVRSSLEQFEEAPIEIVVRGGVTDLDRVHDVVREAADARGIIFFTLVSDVTRKAMKECAIDNFVEAVDVLGPVLSGLNTLIARRGRPRPGQYYKSERAYFDRMDAIDYTLKHDDGQRLNELGRADVVLVGVSRASKSSTCFYLAYRGIRAANVPLLGDREPPPELTRFNAKRVVALTINSRRLAVVRAARVGLMGVATLDEYVDPALIESEIRDVHRQIARAGWASIDVSYMAIEEIAKEVMRLMKESGLRRRSRQRLSGS